MNKSKSLFFPILDITWSLQQQEGFETLDNFDKRNLISSFTWSGGLWYLTFSDGTNCNDCDLIYNSSDSKDIFGKFNRLNNCKSILRTTLQTYVNSWSCALLTLSYTQQQIPNNICVAFCLFFPTIGPIGYLGMLLKAASKFVDSLWPNDAICQHGPGSTFFSYVEFIWFEITGL